MMGPMTWFLALATLLLSLGQTPVVEPPASACTYRGGGSAATVLPDPACTPGAIDPRVTQDNIQETICSRGYTARVRPSTSYTNRVKRQSMADYGVQDQARSAYELDHLVPLEIGGAPFDPANLWPETGASPNPKDRIENELRRRVCRGQMSLADAQQRIAVDWTTALDDN